MLLSQPLSDASVAICILCILLVPLALAGLTLLNTGLGRSRGVAHSMLASLCVLAIAALVYVIFGFAAQGFIGRPAHTLTIGNSTWNWIAQEPLFARGVRRGDLSGSLVLLLQIFSVGLAALIPLGSGLDRWRLGAICASTALMAGITYPLFAHWVWAGGWLAQLGINYGLGHGFVDAGGSSSIQAVGGLTALAIAWILGPRRGKYSREGMPAAIPGHNLAFVLFGCMLALVGWLGLNGAGAILFTGTEAGVVPLVAINTILAAASALLAAVVITRLRFGKPDASLSANGWVGGLVAGSAACAFINPPLAILIGLVAGALVTFSVEWLELHLTVDDPGGAISVHAVCGIWGVFALGVFGRFPSPVLNVAAGPSAPPLLGDAGQWLAQVVGIATLIGFVLPLTYGLNWILNRSYPQRAAPEGERQGMDLSELGAGAYPEFVTHTDEFTRM
ncbi:MAG TPA: ammonium transporter [Terriglobia bacterium]|nr:ammonium transporter [Terriglobia bacterium]